jgi:hypothetical protein
LLAVIAVVIMAREMRPKDEVTVSSPIGTATVAPTIAPQPPEAPVADPPKADPPKDKDDVPEAGKATTPSTLPPPKKTTPPPASSPATPPPPSLSGDAACAEAKRLADNGDPGGAARVFPGCSGSGVAVAKTAIARSAPEAVRRKIFNGDCPGARALLATLNGIGAAGSAAAVLDGAPQCKK